MLEKDKEKKDKLQKLREKIKDDSFDKYECMYRDAYSTMKQRTKNFKFFDRVAHMLNLYDADEVIWSEGSTQSIERKIRAQTIQRVPDGELLTQFDEESIEQTELEYLFKDKVLESEFAGKDMLKNLWRTFDSAYIFGFGCVRTGFERDEHGDIRISYKEIPYSTLFPDPDCDHIEEAEWYIVEEMISHASLKSLLNDKGKVYDKTYDQNTIDYILKSKYTDIEDSSNKKSSVADEEKGVTKQYSVKVRTLYKKGKKEFITYVPGLCAKLRTVKNYDPRLDIPLHFLILEPDPSFPLGVPSVIWTLSQQQFADAFQSSVYQSLLLAVNPPIMGWGNLTPTTYKMEPGAYWNLGNNQNNKVEKFTVETTSITQYGSILEQISSSMNKNMNIMDQTIASDAHTEGWSKTPQGVEQQQHDKTITVNQYQKRIEIFFGEWANHALRSYVSSINGEKEITVDEETRRKIVDYEKAENERRQENEESELKSIVNENKIKINFSELSADRLEFKVRTGSLIQDRQEEQRKAIQETLVSVSQMIGNVSDENKSAFEEILLKMTERLIELSDIDFKSTASKRLNDKVVVKSILALGQQMKQTNDAVTQLQQIMLAKEQGNVQEAQQQTTPRDMINQASQGDYSQYQNYLDNQNVEQQQQNIQAQSENAEQPQEGMVQPLSPEVANSMMPNNIQGQQNLPSEQAQQDTEIPEEDEPMI